MENFAFQMPTRFYFGRGTHFEAGEILRGEGAKKVLVYYGGGSILQTGLYEQITQSLEKAGVDYVALGGVKPNPTVDFCRETVEFIRKNGVDYILAVGGGSVIDSGKMAAMAVASAVDPWDLIARKAEPKGALPLGVVLTMAGSGSEGSESAVLTNEELGRKAGYSSPLNRPRFAILNPELTYTLPLYQMAAGMVDIMMHTAERYVSLSGENELLDGMCEALLRSVIQAGWAAMENPQDYEARGTLMWAATLSHGGLMSTGREYFMGAHRLQHELSAQNPAVVHGAGLAAIWPAYIRHYAPYDLPRFTRYAVKVWGCEMDFFHPERTVEEGVACTEAFFRHIGMPTRLSELGFSEADIPGLATGCTRDGTMILPGLAPLDKARAETIYRLAL